MFVNSPRVARAVSVVALLVMLLLLAQMYGKAYKEQGNDFTSYLLSASALVHGQDPYGTGSVFPYVYPLFLCTVLTPFVFIPYWLACLLWFLIGVSASVASLLIMMSYIAPQAGAKTRLTLSLLTMLLLFGITQNNLLNGQVNYVVMVCVVLFFHSLQAGRRRRASLFLACAISLKLVPAIFLFYLLLRREYASLAWTILLTVLLAFGAPLAFAGTAMLDFYTHYLHSFLFATAGLPASHKGLFSLPGVVQQLFGIRGNLALMGGALAVVLVPAGYLQVKARGKLPADALAFLLYLTGSLLVTPMSETHHLAVLSLPLCAIGCGLYRGAFHRPMPVTVLVGVAVILLASANAVFLFNFFAILIIAALVIVFSRDSLRAPL